MRCPKCGKEFAEKKIDDHLKKCIEKHPPKVVKKASDVLQKAGTLTLKN